MFHSQEIKTKNKMKSLFNPRLIIAAVIVLAFFVFVGCERIDAGHVGIKVKMAGSEQGIQGVTAVTGWCFYSRLTESIFEFPTFVQHKEYNASKDEDGKVVLDESFVVNSKDGSEFHVSPILNYSVRPEKVPAVFAKYRRALADIENGFIKTAVYDAFRMATNKYTADSLISNRELFESRVRQILEKQLGQEGFLVNQFTSNLVYPATFKQAIDAKNAAVQKAFQIENEVKQTEAQAKISIVKTEAEAKIRILNAEAYAESTVKEARADAESNRLRQQSITPLLIDWQLAQSWDGKLPVYGQVPTLFKDIAAAK
jgi:regulator of protease activity HflC (stomatin/prohibitin superfamily)